MDNLPNNGHLPFILVDEVHDMDVGYGDDDMLENYDVQDDGGQDESDNEHHGVANNEGQNEANNNENNEDRFLIQENIANQESSDNIHIDRNFGEFDDHGLDMNDILNSDDGNNIESDLYESDHYLNSDEGDDFQNSSDPELGPQPMIPEQSRVFVTDEQIKQEWFDLTHQIMSARDIYRLRKQSSLRAYNFCISRTYFDRLKTSWSLLTGVDGDHFRKLKKYYLLRNWSKLTTADFGILRKYWTLFWGIMDSTDFRKLGRDYLVLHWARMRPGHFHRLRKNWHMCAAAMGCSNKKKIIKNWLMSRTAYLAIDEYWKNVEEKINHVKWWLDRGADVNAVRGFSGHTLLHLAARYPQPRFVELLLSYGADVTMRNCSGETPLDIVRIYNYKDYDDVMNMIQTTEKSFKKNAARKNKPYVSCRVQQENNDTQKDISPKTEYLMYEGVMTSTIQSEENTWLEQKRQKWCIYKKESSYFIRDSELVDDEQGDIKMYKLLVSIINYMYISKTYRLELKLGQRVNRHERITHVHQVFSRMCTKLYSIYDAKFNQTIDVEFPKTAKLSKSAELVFFLEIHPEVEWVALKVFAVPWDYEYFLIGKAGSRSLFVLNTIYHNGHSLSEEHCDYSFYLSEYYRQFR